MKYILAKNKFKLDYKFSNLLEALKDELLDKQKERVVKVWGEKYLDYETISSTDKIKKGKFKLSDEDSARVINQILNTDVEALKTFIHYLPDGFKDDLQRSFSPDKLEDKYDRFNYDDSELDLNDLSFYDVGALYSKAFKKISLSESKSDQYIVRDENGKPLFDEDKNIVKKDKEPGEIVFTNNYTNAVTLFDDWSKVKDYTDLNIFTKSDFKNIYSIFLDNERIGDFKILKSKDIFLYISDNPKDILNMSVSPFFTSCQELYKGGSHGEGLMRSLLSNVFDPNSVPAFISIDTPYISDGDYLSDHMSISRLIIRNMDSGGFGGGLYFDDTYPGRMRDITERLIEKYSGNKETSGSYDTYIFKPALDTCDFKTLSDPYMDNLEMTTKKSININTKNIIIDSDISDIELKPGSKVNNIVIKTNKIPKNFTDIKMEMESLTFQFMKLNDLSEFSNLNFEKVTFDKCEMNSFKWDSLNDFKPSEVIIKSPYIDSDVPPQSLFDDFEKISLIYAFPKLPQSLLESDKLKVKELTLSGDMLMDKDNVEVVKHLKSKGVKIKKIGLLI